MSDVTSVQAWADAMRRSADWVEDIRRAVKRMDVVAVKETKPDPILGEVITSYRFQTGAFHALIGLLQSGPWHSDEWNAAVIAARERKAADSKSVVQDVKE